MTDKAILTGSAPILIAHRGYSGRYPENTLLAYQAAYQHGARYMELDVQLTADRVPVLHHDRSLKRISGVDADVRDTTAKHFKAMKASYSLRFEDQFSDNEFTTFRRYCKWLACHDDVTTFVEIKQESIDRYGIPVVVDEVLRRIIKSEVEDQCVIISFNDEVVEYTRKVSSMRTGWVLPAWNDKNHVKLQALIPDFLFCDIVLLPKDVRDYWQGGWQLAVYNLDDVNSAIEMANQGVHFIETNQIGTLMSDGVLANRDSV